MGAMLEISMVIVCIKAKKKIKKRTGNARPFILYRLKARRLL
jgi:hypothetical protein